MTAFATTDDLASRWRALSDTEDTQAETLLKDAAIWLRAWFPTLDNQLESGALDAGIPLMVSCSMVKRAMLAVDGVSQDNSSETAGPYAEQFSRTYSNPDGNLYLTQQEQDLLAGRVSSSGAVSMTSPGL